MWGSFASPTCSPCSLSQGSRGAGGGGPEGAQTGLLWKAEPRVSSHGGGEEPIRAFNTSGCEGGAAVPDSAKWEPGWAIWHCNITNKQTQTEQPRCAVDTGPGHVSPKPWRPPRAPLGPRSSSASCFSAALRLRRAGAQRGPCARAEFTLPCQALHLGRDPNLKPPRRSGAGRRGASVGPGQRPLGRRLMAPLSGSAHGQSRLRAPRRLRSLEDRALCRAAAGAKPGCVCACVCGVPLQDAALEAPEGTLLGRQRLAQGCLCRDRGGRFFACR